MINGSSGTEKNRSQVTRAGESCARDQRAERYGRLPPAESRRSSNTPTFTSCLLLSPSEPTQWMIFGRLTPPTSLYRGMKDLIVTRLS